MITPGMKSKWFRFHTFAGKYAEKYLPLSGSVGGLAAGIIFMGIFERTGNAWLFVAGIFSLFYAVYYYRWVTDALGIRQERAE
jgi:hypothetical protein